MNDEQAKRARQIADDLVAVGAYPTAEDAVKAVAAALTAGPPIAIDPVLEQNLDDDGSSA